MLEGEQQPMPWPLPSAAKSGATKFIHVLDPACQDQERKSEKNEENDDENPTQSFAVVDEPPAGNDIEARSGSKDSELGGSHHEHRLDTKDEEVAVFEPLSTDDAVPMDSVLEGLQSKDPLPQRPVVIPIQKVFAPLEGFVPGGEQNSPNIPKSSDGQTDATSHDEALRCPLCLDSYTPDGLNIPKLLPCLHTFCLDCVKVLNRKQCPTCKIAFGTTADALPNNFLSLDILESVEVQAGHIRPCEECDDGDSTHRCVNCFRYLCNPCKIQHARAKATKTHTIQTIEEVRKAPLEIGTQPPGYCPIAGHGEQRTTMYCTTCSQLVCMQCVLLEHPKPAHTYCMVEQAFDVEAKKMQGLVESIEHQNRSLSSAQREIQELLAELKANAETARFSVKSSMDTLRNAILSRQRSLLQDIDVFYQKKADLLSSQLEDMAAASEQMRGAQGFVGQALRMGGKADVLAMKGTLQAALLEAKGASRNLLEPRENAALSFNGDGVRGLEGAIRGLGRVELGLEVKQTPSVMQARQDLGGSSLGMSRQPSIVATSTRVLLVQEPPPPGWPQTAAQAWEMMHEPPPPPPHPASYRHPPEPEAQIYWVPSMGSLGGGAPQQQGGYVAMDHLVLAQTATGGPVYAPAYVDPHHPQPPPSHLSGQIMRYSQAGQQPGGGYGEMQEQRVHMTPQSQQQQVWLARAPPPASPAPPQPMTTWGNDVHQNAGALNYRTMD